MGGGEAIILLACLMATVALCIDVILPAFPQISESFQLSHVNDVQLVISTFLLGLSMGQLVYGPASDSFGRKPALVAGLVLFVIGCVFSLISSSFFVMLLGRTLQGLGLAAPRSVVLALVRDQYQGRAMARLMSTIMAIFIIVPALAPTVGQWFVLCFGWHSIFLGLLIIAMILLVWFFWRHPETLSEHDRTDFTIGRIGNAFRQVFTNKIAMGYTCIAGFITGAYFGYVNSAQQIFQEIYGMGTMFPLYFGILAFSLGAASFVNGRLVMRLGMHLLNKIALVVFFLLSLVYLPYIYFSGGSPFLLFMLCHLIFFFCIGVLFGNLNAIAMEPLGHIAGTASAVIGSLSTLLSVPISLLMGRLYDGTLLPMVSGFTLIGFCSLVLVLWLGEPVSKD